MGPYYKNSTRIVRSWPGSGTADTIYQTEDGRTWLYSHGITPTRIDRTGPGGGIGTIIGDHIVDT